MNTSHKPTPVHDFTVEDRNGRKMAMVYQCREKWVNLKPTDNDQVRHCDQCNQQVFLVSDMNEFERAVAARKCALVKPSKMAPWYLGIVVTKHEPPSSLEWDE